MAPYTQKRIWGLFFVGLCVCHVLTESTLPSSLDVSNTMATPATTTTSPRISTAINVLVTSGDATTTKTATKTTAETNRTLTAEELISARTTADSLLEKANISKTTLGLTTNSKTSTLQTDSYVLAANPTPKPPTQQRATDSSTSAEEYNNPQSTGSSLTTAKQARGPQLTPSPSPLGVEVTRGHLEATASLQSASYGPKRSTTEEGTEPTLLEQRTEVDQSIAYTESSNAGLIQSLGYTHSSMSPTGHSSLAGSDSTRKEEREARTDSMTTQNAMTYDTHVNVTSSVYLKLATDTHITTNSRRIFTTFRTRVATADPSTALHTSMDKGTDTSNISLPINSTSSLNISIQTHTIATTMQMMTGGIRPQDHSETTTTSDSPEGGSSPFCTKLTCFLALWVLAVAASFFLGLSIFLWIRLSAVRKRGRREMERLTGAGEVERGRRSVRKKDGSLWANPGATVDERVEFWYANGTMTHSSDKCRGTGKERRRERRSEKKRERTSGNLWPQPKVTMTDITEFWYGKERPTARNHQTIPEED